MTAAPEQVIWSNEVTKGIFRKTVVETQKITNYRVYQNSSNIGLDLLDDIVVMNQHRVSDSNYYSFGGGMRGAPRIGTGSSTSRSVGDVAFIYQGNPRIVFSQIPDPHGVARLAKAARKRLLEDKKAAEKMNKARLQEEERQRRQQLQQQKRERISTRTTISNDKVIITCPRCSTTNTQGSKYCNNCGLRFVDVVAKEEGTMINPRPSSSSSPLPSYPSLASSSSSSPPSTVKTAEQNVGKFVTCELPSYGIRINYPSDWLKAEQGQLLKPPLLVGFASPRENPSDTFSESVGIMIEPARNKTLEQYIQAGINDLKKLYHNFSLIESVPIKLAGQQGHKLVSDGNGKRHMHAITMREGKVYDIIFTAEPSKYDSYLPIVQKMIDSFEITTNK